MNILKRTLSAFLALVMVFGMVPVSVWASETEAETPEETIVTTEVIEETTSPADPVEESVVQTTAAEETTEAATESEQTVETTAAATEPEQTVAETTEAATEPEETVAETTAETIPEETIPQETEAEELEGFWMEPDGICLRKPEEKTATRTETITVAEPDEYGGYRLKEVEQTFTETYSEPMVAESAVATFSLRPNGNNSYTFESFADLKTLASWTYNQWTSAVYSGPYPLVIEESITLPENLNLRFVGDLGNGRWGDYNDYASMVIPAGVTFTNSRNGNLRIGDLTINGTFEVNETLCVTKNLNIDGELRLTDNTLLLHVNATLTGAENIKKSPYSWGPFRWNQGNIAMLKDGVARACNDSWDYMLDVDTSSDNQVLNENLTIPSNVILRTQGDNAFVVDSGKTLTMNGMRAEIDSPVRIDGALENNSQEFWIYNGSMAFTGSYSGNGRILFFTNLGNWTNVVTGLGKNQIIAQKSMDGYVWILRSASLTQLGTPTALAWNKRVINDNGVATVVDGNGHIYWQAAEPDANMAQIRIYDQYGKHMHTYGMGFGGQTTNDRSVPSFIELDPESGTYYFTVTSVPGWGVTGVYDSVPAISGNWAYTKNADPMPVCTNPQWQWPMATWTDPAPAKDTTSHAIEFLYAPEDDPENAKQIGMGFGYIGESTNLWMDLIETYGAGYYYFRVRAIPDDITQYRIGEWSEMSEPYCYLTEKWLQEQIINGNTQEEELVIELEEDLVIERNFYLPEGVKLRVSDSKITVSSGATLTLDGRIILFNSTMRTNPDSVLNLNSMLFVHDNSNLQIMGSVNYSEHGYATSYYGLNCNVSGVPMDRQALYVFLEEDNRDTWAERIQAAEENKAGYGLMLISIRGEVELPCDLTIKEDTLLHVETGGTLIVPSNVTVTNYGQIYVHEDNSLINHGTIENHRALQIFGELENRAKINVYEAGHVTNFGKVTIYPTGRLWMHEAGTWSENPPIYLGGMNYSSLESMLSNAQNGDTITLSDEVTLERNLVIPENVYLDILPGGKLIVPKNLTLTMNGSIRLKGGDLEVQSGGKLRINSGFYVDDNESELRVDGQYQFGTNALNVSGDIHVTYTGHSDGKPAYAGTISGVDPQHLTMDIDLYEGISDDELADRLASFESGLYACCNLQVNIPLTIDRDFTIPANGRIAAWMPVTVATGCTVTNYCRITVYQTFENDTLVSGLILEEGATINQMPGSWMEVPGEVTNYGAVYIHRGAHLKMIRNPAWNVDGKWHENPPIFLGGTTNVGDWNMTQAKLTELINASLHQGSAVLDQPVTLTGNLIIPANCGLRVVKNGSLIVPDGKTLTINGLLSVEGGSVIVEGGGKLVIGKTGSIPTCNGIFHVDGTYSFANPMCVTDGCDIRGVDNKDLHLYIYVMDSESLHSALAKFIREYDYAERTLWLCCDNLSINYPLTLRKNQTLVLDEAPDGETNYTFNASVTNFGKITVNGNLTSNYDIHNYGEFQCGTMTNSGTFYNYAGGSVSYDNWPDNTPVHMGGTHNGTKFITQSELESKLNKDKWVTLYDHLTLTKNLTIKNGLVIGNNATLIVPAGKTLTVNGTLQLSYGADLIVEEGGTLINNKDIITYATKQDGGLLSVEGDYVHNGYLFVEMNAYTMHDGYSPNIVGIDPWCMIARVENSRQRKVDGTPITDEDLVHWAIDHADDELAHYGWGIQVWPKNSTLTKSITIPRNVTLILNGRMDLYGDITVYGGLELHMYNNVPCHTTIYNDVNIEIKSGGYLSIFGNVYNYGQIDVKSGGELYANGYVENYGKVYCDLGSYWPDHDWHSHCKNLDGGIFDYDRNSASIEDLEQPNYTLKQGVILNRNLEISGDLVVGEEGVIFIPKGMTLTVTGNLTIQDGGRIETYNNGNLTVTGNLYIENDGRVLNYGGNLKNNGVIHLMQGGILYNGGRYTPSSGAVLVRSDYDYWNGFSGAIDGIPLKQQIITGVQVEDEYQLQDMLSFAQQLGVQRMDINAYGSFELAQDLVIPKNCTVSLGNTIVNPQVTVTVNGTLDCENASLTKYDNIVVGKGGKILPYASAVTLNVPKKLNVTDTNRLRLYVTVEGRLPFVTWTSSNKKVIDPANILYDETTNHYWLIGASAGTTTLTATALASGEDGKPVSASVTITVTPAKAESMELRAMPELLKKSAEPQFVNIWPSVLAENGGAIPQNSSSIKWSTSDKKLADVTVNPDGVCVAMIPANAYGMVTITAQLAAQKDITATITLNILDFSPRLASNKLTLNPARNDGVQVALVDCYGNEIPDVSLDNENFVAEYNDNILTIRTISAKLLKDGKINTNLTVIYDDDNSYTYPLTLTIKQSVPSVTVKQVDKLDMFYTDSKAAVSVTAKDAVVDRVELTGTNDFTMRNGKLEFTDFFIRNYQENPKYKPDADAKVLVYLDGYTYPVEKALKISTSLSKLTLVTDPGSGALNTALTKDRTISFRILDKKTKKVQDSYEIENASNVRVDFDTVVVDLGENPSSQTITTITMNVRKDNWIQAVPVTFTVTVTETPPTAVLAKSTLNLSSTFLKQTDSTPVSLSQGNLELGGFRDFQPANGEAKKLEVWYENGIILARVKPGQIPKNGTYSFTATPYIFNDMGEEKDLNPVTVKVKVANAVPTLKLSASNVKLNAGLQGEETAQIGLALTDKTGYNVTIDFWKPSMETHKNIKLAYSNGSLQASLTGYVAPGKYAYTLVPRAYDNVGSMVQLKEVKLTVEVYSGDISIAQSGKGKLDAIDPSSQILYTIGKINNALGKVENVALAGRDAGLFKISRLSPDAKGQQIFALSLKDGVRVTLKDTYLVKFQYTICGTTVTSAEQKIKISQSTLKVTAPEVHYFHAQQSAPVKVNLSVATPVNSQIRQVTLNEKASSKELVAAQVVFVQNTMQLTISNPGALVAGKTYKLALDIIPVGNAADAKVTTVTVNVKVNK